MTAVAIPRPARPLTTIRTTATDSAAMSSSTDRVPVSTIVPRATTATTPARIRAPRLQRVATTTGVPRATRSASQVGIIARPPTFEGRNGSDVSGKPSRSQSRHWMATATRYDASVTVTTIAMTATRHLRPAGCVAWRARIQKTPAYAAVYHVAGQLRLGYGLMSAATTMAVSNGSGARTRVAGSAVGRQTTAIHPSAPPNPRAMIWN